MVERDIIEHFINQIREFVAQTQENWQKPLTGELPEDIDRKLEKLTQDVETFCRVSEQILKKEGISEGEIQAVLKNPEKYVTPKHQQMLEKNEQVRREVESMKHDVSNVLNQIQRREKMVGKRGDLTSKKVARKKKFNRMGGRDGWVPL